MPAELSDLTTADGLQVASDMLQERGWPRCEMTLEGLWSVCPDDVLHELACRYAERVLPVWERRHPRDRRPQRAIEVKRIWLRGCMKDQALDDAYRAVLAAKTDAHLAAGITTESDDAAKNAYNAIDCAVRAAEAAAIGPGYGRQRVAFAAVFGSAREALDAQRFDRGSADSELEEQLRLTVAYMLEVGAVSAMALPDLETREGLAVASDMLAEQGWQLRGGLPADPLEAIEALLPLCTEHLQHELACRYAEHVLFLWQSAHPRDDRPRLAIEAKRAWLTNDVSDQELAQAREEASDAAVNCSSYNAPKEAASAAADAASPDSAFAATASIRSVAEAIAVEAMVNAAESYVGSASAARDWQNNWDDPENTRRRESAERAYLRGPTQACRLLLAATIAHMLAVGPSV